MISVGFKQFNTFYERLEDCLGMINGCRPVDGQEPVKLPGQIEAQNKADAIAKGIELPADVIETLHQECTKVGLSFVPATS